MNARRALLLACSLLEIARFFLQLSLLSSLLRDAAGAGPWVLPWLIFGGSGALVIAVGGVMLSLFPTRYGGTVALLRIGKILESFSFVLLAVSGALRMGSAVRLFSLGAVMVSQTPVLVLLFLLDLLFLVVLLSWRRDDGRARGTGGEQPPYSETEVGDYH
jgi:hypothetical protein